MNYRKVYKMLVDNRLANSLPKEEYGEVHHIVPKAEGGSDDTEESKKKMSFSQKGKKLTEEHKNKIKATLALPDVKVQMSAAISKAQKGSFWVTDGKTNHFLSKGSTIPDGFYIGRTINSKSTTGYHWYSNGVKNVLAKDCPGEGWKRGKIK